MDILTQTPRLVIRLFQPDEMETYMILYNDERVTQYLPYRSREEHIRLFQDNLAAGPAGSITGRWGIFNKVDGNFIGMCLLRLFDDGSDAIELGYVLHHHYWGKSIASETAQGLLDHMRAIRPDAKFVAITELQNIPSQRVLEKVGLQRDGNYSRNGVVLAYFTSVMEGRLFTFPV